MITSQVIQDLVINNVITGTSDLAKHMITKHVLNPRNHTQQTHHQLTPDPVPHLVAHDLTSKQEDLSQRTLTSAKALTHISRSRSIECDSDPGYIINNHVIKSRDLHVTCQVQNPFSHVTSLARDHYNPQTLPEHVIPIHVTSPVTPLGQDLRQLSEQTQEPNLLQPHSATLHVTKSGDHFASRNQVPHQSSDHRWPATAITQSRASTPSGQTLDQSFKRDNNGIPILGYPPSERRANPARSSRACVDQSRDQAAGSSSDTRTSRTSSALQPRMGKDPTPRMTTESQLAQGRRQNVARASANTRKTSQQPGENSRTMPSQSHRENRTVAGEHHPTTEERRHSARRDMPGSSERSIIRRTSDTPLGPGIGQRDKHGKINTPTSILQSKYWSPIKLTRNPEQKRRHTETRRCYQCKEIGHLQKDCPELQTEWIHSIERWATHVANEPTENDGNSSDDQEQAMDCRAMTLGGIRRTTQGLMSQESQQWIQKIQELPDKDRALLLGQVYAEVQRSLRIFFKFKTKQRTTVQKALLDSGASDNFLNIKTWETLGIGRVELQKTIAIHNADGTSNQLGAIKYYCWLKVKTKRQTHRMRLYLTNLGKDTFILGYPFLRTFNPTIDWTKGQIKETLEIETLGRQQNRITVRQIQLAALKECGWPEEGQALYLRKASIAQEWAHKARETESEAKKPQKIPAEYAQHWKVFDEEMSQRFPPERKEDMKIEFLPDAPSTINCKVYPLNPKEQEALRTFLREEQAKGYIEMGSSAYTSPLFFIGKKDSEELRPIMDYRELNKWTKKDNNTLPSIKTALENLQDGEIYSKFDLRWGYKNLRIRSQDCHKAAFKTTEGTYIPKVTYFGLTNAPPTFQRIMQRDLQPLLQKYPKNFGNYLDDCWVGTRKNSEERALHRKITHEFLKILEEESYFLKLSKCQFEVEDMELLGWRVGNGEVRIDPGKIAGLKEWPRELKNKKAVQKTMGILNYLRPVIRGFSGIAKPITELTKNDRPFKWTEECTKALNKLIDIATSDPVLKCPDPLKPFELVVDASAFAIGAVLIQKNEEGKDRHVGYYSKSLNPTEWNYDIWDREFMAVVLALRNWRHLLMGSLHKVIVYTDHSNLQYYRHPQKINRQVARYISTLADYNLELKHLPGIKNRADPLSRRPDYDNGSEDNEHVTALPDHLFTRVIETVAFDEQIRQQQKKNSSVIEAWNQKGLE